MSALAWWLIPIGATILAILWAMFRARPEKPAEAHAGMAGLRRLADAMERPMPSDQIRQPIDQSKRGAGAARTDSSQGGDSTHPGDTTRAGENRAQDQA